MSCCVCSRLVATASISWRTQMEIFSTCPIDSLRYRAPRRCQLYKFGNPYEAREKKQNLDVSGFDATAARHRNQRAGPRETQCILRCFGWRQLDLEYRQGGRLLQKAWPRRRSGLYSKYNLKR